MAALRTELAPRARIAILSNSALVSERNIREALARLDFLIMKLDCGSEPVFKTYNRPCRGVTLEGITDGLEELSQEAGLTIQTLLSSGDDGNDEEINVSHWLRRLQRIRPRSVQLYTLDRGFPARRLLPAAMPRLQEIKNEAERSGISIEIYF